MLWNLFLTFFRIGAFTFGGGYAMISVIENICVEKKHWITHEDLVNVTVIAESTPGPVAINCATFVGYKQKGLLGSIAATLGVVLPSFIIIWAISMFLERFLEIAWVASAFRGVRVALLILDVGIRMAKKMPKEPIRIILLIAALVLMVLINLLNWKISTIVLLLCAAAVSLIVFLFHERKGGEQA